ncbi:MAG: M20/M25/M40 family metallo-hydrolase, partial [Phycisphaerales bacterium]
YDYMNSRLADGEKIEAEFDLRHTFTPGPIPVYNTVAEIPGVERPDECIIVSAHLDSWDGPGSMGTTDNGTGSAVTLEAARLLMAAGARPKRTIKFILWTGEEQGLLGSREWVRQHEHLWPNISAVFVDDGGTNTQGGLKCTDAMAPMLAAATAPVNFRFFDARDGRPLNVNIQPGGERFNQSGGSDHAAFIAKGIPGFFWDEVGRAEYGYGWHTQNDTIDLAIPEYLMQSATCSAITAYNLACAPGMLPRFPMDSGSEDPPRRRGE